MKGPGLAEIALRDNLVSEIKEHLFTEEDLIKKALASKNLTLKQSNPFFSDTIITYLLNGVFLEGLEKNGFKLTKRDDGVITLSDEYSSHTGINSCYWNFRNREGEKDELALALGVGAAVNQRQRGVVLMPHAPGTFLSPAAIDPQKRVFEVAVQVSPTTPPIVHEIVNFDGEITVSWTEFGLGGIRDLKGLFREFSNRDDMIEQLCRSGISPFWFNPFTSTMKDGLSFKEDKLFLPEPFQPMLFHIWTEQLKEFKNRF